MLLENLEQNITQLNGLYEINVDNISEQFCIMTIEKMF